MPAKSVPGNKSIFVTLDKNIKWKLQFCVKMRKKIFAQPDSNARITANGIVTKKYILRYQSDLTVKCQNQ